MALVGALFPEPYIIPMFHLGGIEKQMDNWPSPGAQLGRTAGRHRRYGPRSDLSRPNHRDRQHSAYDRPDWNEVTEEPDLDDGCNRQRAVKGDAHCRGRGNDSAETAAPTAFETAARAATPGQPAPRRQTHARTL